MFGIFEKKSSLMKIITYLFCFSLIMYSCKQEKTNVIEESSQTEDKIQPTTVAEKIAHAHGFENWERVKSFEFTFGGKLEDTNSGRSWVWNPKTNDVKLTSGDKVIEYNRNEMDSIALTADRAFINDKFWALIPFQLIWDTGTTISEPIKEEAPISKQIMNKVVLTYSNEGGYTPGDAYDIYYDDNYIIREWNFRQGNAAEPSLTNTFENYSDYQGIKVAQDHKKAEGDWNLLVRNVKVTLE